MPCFRLELTLPEEKIPSDLAKKICHALAPIMKISPKQLIVIINPGVNITFGGILVPSAQGSLYRVRTSKYENSDVSVPLIRMLSTELEIPPERMFITFFDFDGCDVGHKDGTF